MNIGVILVNYNTRELLRRSLASIFASAAAGGLPSPQVVVVDNASQDGSAAMVAECFPQVRLVASPQNLGYTRGNNLGLRLLGFDIPTEAPLPPTPASTPPPDAVLLLNPDAELVEDALGQLAGFLQHTPDAGACGAHLRYGDGRFQHGAFRFPSLAQVALDFFPLTGLPGAHRLHHSRLNGRYPARLWQGRAPFPVDFVLGAAWMVRGEALRTVGGLDEGYFMYCEEMDWCLRLAQAGWRTYAVPTARVIHHEGQSSRQVRWHAYEQLWRSRLRFYRKHRQHYPPGHLAAVWTLVRLGLWWRRRQILGAFAAGELDGSQTAAALSAFTHIARMGWP